MKLLNISRGRQKKRGKDRFGAAGNLNKMHAPDTLRITHIDPPVVSNFIQTPPVNKRILLEPSHTLR